MKKMTAIFLVILLLFSMAACGGGTQSEVSAPVSAAADNDYETAALEMADALQQADFAAVTARFDETMKLSLSEKDIAAVWEQTVGTLGAYTGRGELERADVKGGCTIVVPEIYEQKTVEVRIAFKEDGFIQGLFFAYRENEQPAAVVSLPQGIKEETVTVAADASLPLEGTLTLPENAEKPPVVVLIQGSGQSDRDETIGKNKPFRDLAWGLAQKGIATLRYDKRYYTYAAAAQGNNLTVYDEILDDAQAAISLLQKDGRVDNTRIFVLGHSQGGMLIPYIAAKNPELAGCISMAGSLRPLWEIMYDQNIELADSLRSTLSEAETAVLDAQLKQLEEAIKKIEKLENGAAGEDVLLGLPVKYWQSLAETTGAAFLEQAHQPFLILQGDADFQVYPDKDYPLWQAALEGRSNVAFHLYKGLNHLMMPTSGKRDTTEYEEAKNVSDEVIADIAAFVENN